MRRRPAVLALLAALGLVLVPSGCNPQSDDAKPRMTLFVGVDTSGSFLNSGSYEDSLSFLAYYIYGHLNQLGGLSEPRELFVAALGGDSPDEPKTFRPIHDFDGKDIEEIEYALREWYQPDDSLTDFNAFFGQVARIVKERNLILAPVDIMIVTDGVPDLSSSSAQAGSQDTYESIDLSSLEYLSRRLTLRLAYASPIAAGHWRQWVSRQRVRLWTIDAEVMEGWRGQLEPNLDPAAQDRLWDWIRDNVDYRARVL